MALVDLASLMLTLSLIWLASGQQNWDNYALKVGQAVAFGQQPVAQLTPTQQKHLTMLHYYSDCQKRTLQNKVVLDPRVEMVDVHTVRQCLNSGACILVDARGDDRESGTIAGAMHVPLLTMTSGASSFAQKWASPLVVFHCQFSAHRAPGSANAYVQSARAGQRVAIMQGGFNEWKCLGLPVNKGPVPVNTGPLPVNKGPLPVKGGSLNGGSLPVNSGSLFNVNDNVVVWSTSEGIWHDDGRVIGVDTAKGIITVQYKNKKKDLLLPSTHVHKSNGPLQVSDRVFVWSNGNQFWFQDGQVLSVDRVMGTVTVRYNNQTQKTLPLWTKEVSKIPRKHEF